MKLVEIDLRKGGVEDEDGFNYHLHPDIKCGSTWYLAKINRLYYVGTFSKEWFGLTFDCDFGECGSIQFDTPGTNASDWKRLWLLVPDKVKRKKAKKKVKLG